MAKKTKFRFLRFLASLFANATVILSANYIVFYILDHYNPGLHFVIHSTFFLTEYLHWIVAVLCLITGLIYLLLFTIGAFDHYIYSKSRLIRILIIDFIFAVAFAMTVNTYAFDWLHLREVKQDEIIALATFTPAPTVAPTSEPTIKPTERPTPATSSKNTEKPTQNVDSVSTDTPEPTSEPTSTPIPGLLGNDFADKFSTGEPVISEPGTQSTLADGTIKTLLYTYSSQKVAIELYHYQKGKLEYQIADLYVRELKCLTTDYVTNGGQAKMLYNFARDLNAIIAINSDYYVNNAINEGLIIRNGNLIQSKVCKNSDLCVIYQDGTMKCYDCKKDKIDNNEIIASFPYHAFYFGPSLLDSEGNTKSKFNSTVGTPNPRSAIGYYQPGHYAFISILGTRGIQNIKGKSLGNGKSPGMSFTEMSELCHDLGMVCAYNLDGGGSAGMYWNEQLFGHNNRITGDVIAIVDPQ